MANRHHRSRTTDTSEAAPSHARCARSGNLDGKLGRITRDYGWRAYAVPLLAFMTVWMLVNIAQHPGEEVVATADKAEMQVAERDGRDSESDNAEADDTSAGTSDDAAADERAREPAELPEGKVDTTELPPGGPYTEAGEETYYEVGSTGAEAGSGDEIVVRYVVEVEHGVDTSNYGGDDAFAAMIDATLADPRGWTNDPRFRFEHVSGDDNPTLKIRLTSVGTTRKMCGADIGMETSCRTRITGEDTVVVNESRWVRGAAPFEGDLGRYRQYLINHEVGHALGFSEHVPCPADGDLAPIMMQQTLSLNNAELRSFDPSEVYPDNPDTCRSNPWPYPRPAVQ